VRSAQTAWSSHGRDRFGVWKDGLLLDLLTKEFVSVRTSANPGCSACCGAQGAAGESNAWGCP
jgi:hypothetical protein